MPYRVRPMRESVRVVQDYLRSNFSQEYEKNHSVAPTRPRYDLAKLVNQAAPVPPEGYPAHPMWQVYPVGECLGMRANGEIYRINHKNTRLDAWASFLKGAMNLYPVLKIEEGLIEHLENPIFPDPSKVYDQISDDGLQRLREFLQRGDVNSNKFTSDLMGHIRSLFPLTPDYPDHILEIALRLGMDTSQISFAESAQSMWVNFINSLQGKKSCQQLEIAIVGLVETLRLTNEQS